MNRSSMNSETGGQVYVLLSESIILPVIRSLDLAHDPEFVGDADKAKHSLGIGKFLKKLVGMDTEPALDPEASLERMAVTLFLKRFTVTREDVASVISVSFSSEDPKKAARIVNAIVDFYIAATSDVKSQSNKMATEVLQGRLSELKQSVLAANKAVEEFKAANNLINKGSSEQLTELTRRLADARAQLVQAKSRADRIQQQTSSEGTAGAIYPDNPENQILSGLRTKYLDLSTQATELAGRVGSNHSAVLKLRKEMEDTRSAMREEEKRVAGFYVAAYQAARTQSTELAAMMQQLSEDARTESQPQTTLRQLESAANTLRDSYNSSLEKFNSLNVQPVNPIQDARIITRASPQLGKSLNKSLAVLGGGIGAGLLLGVGGAIGREYLAGVFRTREQVKQATGLYCVNLPLIEANGKQVASSKANSMLLEDYVLDAPHSRFAEGLRKIKVLIDGAKRDHGEKVIGVASAVSNTGKSTVLTNLAALTAASGRTLVIDCDLHLRRLTSMLEPDARHGLMEALEDPSRLAALVRKRPRSGVDFLPCVLSKRLPNAAELLGSSKMERLLAAAREDYDFIIIGCPPIMPVVDVKMMERFIDRFVFVIEWGQTPRRAVQEALDDVDITRERTLCCVLNKVDPAELQRVDAYKDSQQASYYEA